MKDRYKKYVLLAQEAQMDPDLYKDHMDAKIPMYLESELDQILLTCNQVSENIKSSKGDSCRDKSLLQQLQYDSTQIKDALNIYNQI